MVCIWWRTDMSDGLYSLICRADGLAYPIRDGIPVMLQEQARPLTLDEKLG